MGRSVGPNPFALVSTLGPFGLVPGQSTSTVAMAGSQRVGDAQRDEVHALLGQALAMGYLDPVDFDARTDATFHACTSADLAGVISDLPVTELRRHDPVRRAALARTARTGVRIHTAAFVLVTLALVAVWLVGAVGYGAWYPWPVWPTLGWGVGVATHAIPVHLAFQQPRRA